MKPSLTDSADGDAGESRRTRRRERRQRRGRGRRARAEQIALHGGRLDFGPRPLRLEEDRPPESMLFRPPRRIDVGAVLAGLFGIGTLLFVGYLVQRGMQVDVDQRGIEDGASFGVEAAAALEVVIGLDSADRAQGATLHFDGEPVEEPEVDGDRLTWRPPGELEEGEHALELSVARPIVGNAEFRWDFTVDHTAPDLELPAVVDPVAMDAAVEVAGQAEPGTSITADGTEVDVDDDGAFTLSYDRPPPGAVDVRATDPAGNVTESVLVVPVTYPGARAVHATSASWASDQLRGPILRMLDEGRIDTVVLELKNRGGVVGYDTQVERAHQIGAVTPFFDLDEAVRQIESHGGRVVGRVAVFRDPQLAQAAWGAGQRAQVVQTPDGRPYEEPGEFTSFADPAVRRYNLDIALDAVGRGVDDILWDDVRRPGSAAETMVVPGLNGEPADALVGFLAQAHAELRRRGAYQGVTTAGITAKDGGLVAQDVTRMARNADYLVPTIHPGYWGNGGLGVSDPPHEPAALVDHALDRYEGMTEGTGVVLVPSLQDFSAGGVTYGDAQVRAQIDAARARGVGSFMLWDPNVRYSAGGVPPG